MLGGEASDLGGLFCLVIEEIIGRERFSGGDFGVFGEAKEEVGWGDGILVLGCWWWSRSMCYFCI